MARRLPRRGAGGRFLKGGGGTKRRRSPRRRSSSSRRRRRTMRANPSAPKLSARGLMKQTVQGVQDAAWIVGGKAVSRAVPTMLNLPKEGVLGLGVQLATAIAAGYLAHSFGGANAGRLVLAGGLTAPLETAIVAWRVPFLAPALSPMTAAVQVGAYRQPLGLAAYVPRSAQLDGMGAYVQRNTSQLNAGDDY